MLIIVPQRSHPEWHLSYSAPICMVWWL